MQDDSGRKFVPAVLNAAMILRLLAAAGRPMGATEIARESDLNVSTAFNILRTLAHEGLLSFDPQAKTYRIGMGAMEIATPLLGADPADVVRPLLTAIAQDNHATIALWQITRAGRIVLIDRFTAERIVQVVVSRNGRLPVFAGAVGRCYAAARRLDETQTYAGYDTVRWQSPPGFASYWRDVLVTRETGFARDRENLYRGLEIIASVARDAAGTPRLGISSIAIAGQHDAAGLDRIALALADAATRIERGVFGRADAPGPGPGHDPAAAPGPSPGPGPCIHSPRTGARET